MLCLLALYKYPRCKSNINIIRNCFQFTKTTNEVCEYPPIIDMSTAGRKRHQRQLWYDSIKALPTAEQKLYELTLHSRPRQKRYLIFGQPPTENAALFQRYITRTHLVDHLPEKITQFHVDEEYDEIIDVLKETVALYYFNNWQCTDQTFRDILSRKNDSSQLVNNLASRCFQKLAFKNHLIMSSTIQQRPRLNSYWFHQGFYSKGDKFHEKNLAFQFNDYPSFTIRIKEPLNPILYLNDPLCATAEVPDFHYHPGNLGIRADKKWLTSVPGYWFGDPCEYPYLLVQATDNLEEHISKRMQFYDLCKIKDSMGITLSFGWLNAVATYQGFTPFHDLTYPLVSQAILTNGRDWNFYVYQLNTIAFHEDVDKKDRRNICWSSGTMRLFDRIEDGKIIGFNDKVLKVFLKLIFHLPYSPQTYVDLKPYLGEANLCEEDLRNMRYFYRRMYSQAPDPQAFKNETPTWQKIYVYSKHAKPMPFVKME